MDLAGIKWVVLDIEGTVLPISFVKEVMFKYVRDNIRRYLDENWGKEEEIIQAVEYMYQFKEDYPAAPEIDGTKDSVIDSVFWQMDRDVKDVGLKHMQGLIWRDAFKKGELKCDLYDDVYEALPAWHAKNLKIATYSSGSCKAQQDLFNYTKRGSMADFISSFHDLLMTGPKLEADSYTRLSKKLGCEPEEILFLTDVYGEYSAAVEAGLRSIIVVRPGNKPLSAREKSTCTTISSFSELKFPDGS